MCVDGDVDLGFVVIIIIVGFVFVVGGLVGAIVFLVVVGICNAFPFARFLLEAASLILFTSDLSCQTGGQGRTASTFILDASADVVDFDVLLELEVAIQAFEVGRVLAA